MTTTPESESAPVVKRSLAKELIAVAIALLVGAGLALAGWLYWSYSGAHPSTDDAYIHANTVWIAPRVAGQVVQVAVQDNQAIKAGDLLLRIDPVPFAAELAKASSAAALARQEIEVQRAAVSAAQAKVDEQQALVDSAKQQFERLSALVARGDEPKLKGIELEDTLKAAQATLNDLRAELLLAENRLGPPAIQDARVNQADAEVNLAKLRLDWTEIRAPADGWVTRVDARPGEVVAIGDPLFVLVEAGQWWVQANFKEGRIGRITAGMPARIQIDLYGNQVFDGLVQSIAPASAASFSLLPAQNTTGNWVKVTQRIPVRIKLAPMRPEQPYRVGASVTATVMVDAVDAVDADKPAADASSKAVSGAAPQAD